MVFQGASPGSFVARCQASDADAARNARVSYHLVQGADNKFSIDNATGVITTSGSFDIDADPKEYTVYMDSVFIICETHLGYISLVSSYQKECGFFTCLKQIMVN